MKKFGTKLLCLLLCAAAVFSLCALPAAAAGEDDYNYYTNPQPEILITRKDMEPVKPGQEFLLQITMSYNNCYQTVQSPKVTFTPSDAFMIIDATPSKGLNSFKRNEQASVSIRLRALAEIKEPVQYVDVKVDFYYDHGSTGLGPGKAEEKVFIPVVTSTGIEGGKPMVSITRGDIGTVSANQSIELHAFITNQSSNPLSAPTLTVSPCSELLNMDATKTRQLDTIPAGETLDVPIKLKAAGSITSPSLSVDLELKQGGLSVATETIYVPATVNSNDGGSSSGWTYPTPSIIISKYDFGADYQVAAGSTFDLTLEFTNTSKVFKVDSLDMTISPDGEGFSIASGVSTAHYDVLAIGETLSETFSISALPTAKTGPGKLVVTFVGSYVENGTRNPINQTQTISIPIYQPDRFEVELPQLPDYVDAYNEMYISMPYVNKGKSEVSNIRAEIISEDGAVTSINPVQNLGNFASGASGTIDFIFSPQMSGEVNFSFRITYEDPNAQEKVLDFPVTMMVNEPYYPSFDDPGMFDPGFIDEPVKKAAMPWWVWCVIGVVVVAAVIVVVTLAKKKRAKAAGELSDFVWDEQTGDVGSGTGGKE